MDGRLILMRHGESEWNAKHLWTGWTDIGLTARGRKEAKIAAQQIVDIHFDAAFTSSLSRAQETLTLVLGVLHQSPPVTKTSALNERSYGIFTGKNKFEIAKEIGEEAFLKLRRGWDVPIQDGESLKDVYARVVPYFQKKILPLLRQGKHVLIAAHGNSLRALIKFLDMVPDEDIAQVEIQTGAIVMYTFDHEGRVTSKGF